MEENWAKRDEKIAAMVLRSINPWEAFWRNQAEKGCPGRSQDFGRQKEDDTELQSLDPCTRQTSPRSDHILLCPSPQTTVCWDGPHSLSLLWPLCVCIFFAPQLEGHRSTFVFAAGHQRGGPLPPSSHASEHQRTKRLFPFPSHPAAFWFWTGWTVKPLGCTINWLVTVTFDSDLIPPHAVPSSASFL